jgi:ligand-binding SRPBCC domain-containing protein
MPRFEISTFVAAPIGFVFDLARSIDAHAASQSSHAERAIAGRVTGLIEAGEEVTWEAVHFGMRQRLSSRIVTLTRPVHFRDSMLRGAFKRFDHDHFFTALPDGTMMRDVFDFTSPLGPLGRLADGLFLESYMRRLLIERNQALKQWAESGEGRKYLSAQETRSHE